MPFYNRPLVPVAILYISGIVFARFFFLPSWLCIFVLITALCIRNKIFFHISIFFIGYLFYTLSLNFNFFPSCEFLKENIMKTIYYNMPLGEEKNFLSGLLLGERYKISKELTDILRNTNTMHVLAISGDHIGFVGIMLFAILRMVFVPRKLSALLASIIVLIYVSVVSWQAPTFRAAVMFGILAISWIIDRPNDPVNILSLAAIVILLITPQALFQAGFQLSFIIVLCLLAVIPSVKGSCIKKTLLGSCTAWVSSLPLVVYYFKVISPIAILANLVVVPGISIIIAIGFTSMLLGNIYIGFSGIFNAANYWFVKILLRFLKFMSSIPCGHFEIRNYPLYGVILAYVIFIICFSLLQKRDSVVE